MRVSVGVLALCWLSVVASAQRSPTQNNLQVVAPRAAEDSSLVGMKAVYLTGGGNSLDSATFSDFSLELRKSGIRVVSADQPADAQMFITVSKLRCGLGGCDGLFTIQVDQKVQLTRTGRGLQTTTWHSATLGLGIEWATWVRATAHVETNAFLSRWLSANGR